MSSLIINHLPDLGSCSYLELGIRDNKNFDQIKAGNKFSVDLNGKAMFTGTTDEYFAGLTDQRFDIIFIDACHDYANVVRDFNNSVERCDRWILLHDMIPPSARYTASDLCSDSYRVLFYMLTAEKFELYPMNENFGLTLVKMPASRIEPAAHYADTTYDEFCKFMQRVRLYSASEIIDILRNDCV